MALLALDSHLTPEVVVTGSQQTIVDALHAHCAPMLSLLFYSLPAMLADVSIAKQAHPFQPLLHSGGRHHTSVLSPYFQ